MIEITEELKAHFLRLYTLAFSDENFHPLELKLLYNFAHNRGISKEKLDELLLNPTSFNSTIPESLDSKLTYLYQFCQMIWADGKVDENEKNALRKYIKLFNFEEENITELSNYLLDAVKNKIALDEILKEI